MLKPIFAMSTLFAVLATLAACSGTDDSTAATTSYMESARYMDVSAAEAKQLMERYADLVIIDVSPYYAQGHLPGARSYPVGSGALDAAIPMLSPKAKYLVYCHGDAPSMLGAQKLVDAGFTTVYRLAGNYQAWVDAGYPVEH